jgi:hypothetical protein
VKGCGCKTCKKRVQGLAGRGAFDTRQQTDMYELGGRPIARRDERAPTRGVRDVHSLSRTV